MTSLWKSERTGTATVAGVPAVLIARGSALSMWMTASLDASNRGVVPNERTGEDARGGRDGREAADEVTDGLRREDAGPCCRRAGYVGYQTLPKSARMDTRSATAAFEDSNMKKLAIAAMAAVALGALSPAAQAVVFNDLNQGPNGLRTFTFGDNDIGNGSSAPGAFTRTFTFNTVETGTLSLNFGDVASSPVNNVEFTSANLNGTAVNLFSFVSFPLPGAFLPGQAGEPDIGFLLNVAVGVGNQLLTIMGTNGGNGVFAGTAAFSPVPVPGPIAGAGLPAMLGLAGAWFWRRRRAQHAV